MSVNITRVILIINAIRKEQLHTHAYYDCTNIQNMMRKTIADVAITPVSFLGVIIYYLRTYSSSSNLSIKQKMRYMMHLFNTLAH